MADTRPLIRLYRCSENPHKYTLFRFASKEKSTDPMIPHQTDASVRDQGCGRPVDDPAKQEQGPSREARENP